MFEVQNKSKGLVPRTVNYQTQLVCSGEGSHSTVRRLPQLLTMPTAHWGHSKVCETQED